MSAPDADPGRGGPPPGEVHVWWAPTALAREPALVEAYEALLAPEEASRHQAFRTDARRHEYLVSRALVRSVLSRYRAVSPEAWRFRASLHGRPELDAAHDLHFNLANCPDLVVCAVSRREVGVDAEPRHRADQILALTPHFLSGLERAALEALPSGDERRWRALLLWTLKEAYSKALGVGLSLSFSQVTFAIEDGHAALEGAERERWRLVSAEVAGHQLSVAAERAVGETLAFRAWRVTPLRAAEAWPELATRLGAG